MMVVNGENTDKRLRKETLVQEHITAARLHLVVLFEDRYLFISTETYTIKAPILAKKEETYTIKHTIIVSGV